MLIFTRVEAPPTSAMLVVRAPVIAALLHAVWVPLCAQRQRKGLRRDFDFWRASVTSACV
eukprot:6672026-Prymnesium_polylepis.1